MTKNIIKSTTIIGIRKDNSVVIAGDGQASLGNTIMKANVKKVRRLGTDESVIAGFAGVVVSTVRFNALDAAEIFPAASVAVTVNE